ncbi:MAG: spore gernimation protein [Bacillales bacterium]|nr:spore gernimation protein [Bacillales bacterium]
MNDLKERITNSMFVAIFINMMYSKSIGITQGSMAREVGNDIWIATLLSSLQALIVMLIVIWIIEKYPSIEPTLKGEMKIAVSGIKKLINILMFIFFAFAFGNTISTYVFHMRDYFLPEVPIWLLIFFATLIGVLTILYGLEVIGRTALIGVVLFCAYNILLVAGSIKEFDIRELQPVLSSGISNNLWTSRHLNADWAIPTMATFYLYPRIKKKEFVRKSSVIAIVFSSGLLVIWPILINGVISNEIASQYIVTCVQMAKSLEIGDYFHRLEIFMVLFGEIAILVQIAVILYCAAESGRQIYKLDSYKILIIPIAVAFSVYGNWLVQEHQRALNIIEHLWVTISLWTAIIVPLLFLLLGYIYQREK